MKKLVVYFSRVGENSVNGNIEIIKKGFTEILAEKIASLTGAVMFKIEPVDPYPADYNECVKRSRKEDETGEYVPYLHPLPSLDEYDVIYLGFIFFSTSFNTFVIVCWILFHWFDFKHCCSR